MNQIEELAQRIGRELDADRIVLFGSYAHGVSTDYSAGDAGPLELGGTIMMLTAATE